MYVTNYQTGTVSVIDTETNKVTNTITVGIGIVHIAFDSVNNRMYVANSSPGTVSVIDTKTNKVTNIITVGTGVQGMAFDSAKNRMYVVNYTDGTVLVIGTLDEEDEEDGINILEEAVIVAAAATTTTITADHLKKTKNITNNIEVKIYGGIMGFCFGKAYTKLTSKSANIKRIVLESFLVTDLIKF
uniref:Uncharacterized protein n=1 Tax=viral metagenome TaxID=1070528 RepID=A0A6C0EHK5_9ZZZZ